jgi:pimeloyl-ACP methyl ester carboxylesterase
MVKLLPRGELHMIIGCGHLPALERPEQFLVAVDRFLEIR